jgi:hypothetical protein
MTNGATQHTGIVATGQRLKQFSEGRKILHQNRSQVERTGGIVVLNPAICMPNLTQPARSGCSKRQSIGVR